MTNNNQWAVQLIERWFNSSAWKEVCFDADDGCRDSFRLMEEVNSHLESLLFHLNNKSGGERLGYEMDYFEKLCDDFDVAQTD